MRIALRIDLKSIKFFVLAFNFTTIQGKVCQVQLDNRQTTQEEKHWIDSTGVLIIM